MLINVPTNCGKVVKRLRMPRYIPAVSPVEESALEESSSRSRWLRRRNVGEGAGEEKSSLELERRR